MRMCALILISNSLYIEDVVFFSFSLDKAEEYDIIYYQLFANQFVYIHVPRRKHPLFVETLCADNVQLSNTVSISCPFRPVSQHEDTDIPPCLLVLAHRLEGTGFHTVFINSFTAIRQTLLHINPLAIAKQLLHGQGNTDLTG